MLQNVAPFEWDEQREKAARLLADGELTDAEVAGVCDTTRMTLWRWKQHPEFKAKITEHVKEAGDVARRYAIGRKERRLKNLNDRYERLHQAIRDRAADPGLQDVPGGPTGLVVQQVKGIGAGVNFEKVKEYRIDIAVLAELRECERQAALEARDWSTKTIVSGPGGGPVPVTIIEFRGPEADAPAAGSISG